MRARAHDWLGLLAGAALLCGTAACGDAGKRAAGPAGGAAAAPEASATGAERSGGTTSPPATGPPARGEVRTIAVGLAVPWDIDFLPGGDALVTERDRGRIVRVPTRGGDARTVLTVPGVVPGGEGGLLGLAVSPRYASDHDVDVYFTAAGDNRIARIDLRTKRTTPIVTGLRKGQIHNGGALAFGPDGDLYAGVGETGDSSLAQDPALPNGKILRYTTRGKVPASNPFPGSPVWSLGHRNVQGLAWDDAGRLWASEFGQSTTDEVNLIEPGHNYGWPVVEGKGSTHGGKFTNPVVTWSPTSTSSPSGAAISGSTLYVGALAGETLWRIPLHGTSAGTPQALYRGDYGRIRAVAKAPDGSIWFSTSNRDGRGDPHDGDDLLLQLGT